MNETFPRKPFLDRIIVRKIPVEDYYEQSGSVVVDLDNAHIKVESDRGVVVAIGNGVPDGEVSIGDIVFYDDYATSDKLYLNPADRNRTDLPKYFIIRLGDLKARAV